MRRRMRFVSFHDEVISEGREVGGGSLLSHAAGIECGGQRLHRHLRGQLGLMEKDA